MSKPHINSIILLLSFKIVRVLRRKYRLSFNCIMVLNAIYLYSINKPVFTLTGVQTWLKYYDLKRFKRFSSVLYYKGFIKMVKETKGGVRYYEIDSKVLTVMEELSNSYNSELSLFLSSYDISL